MSVYVHVVKSSTSSLELLESGSTSQQRDEQIADEKEESLTDRKKGCTESSNILWRGLKNFHTFNYLPINARDGLPAMLSKSYKSGHCCSTTPVCEHTVMHNFSERAENPEKDEYICTLCYLPHSPPANEIPDSQPTQHEIILNTMRQDNPHSLVATTGSSSGTEIMRRRSNYNRDDVSSSYYPLETHSVPVNKFYDHRSTIDAMDQTNTGGRVKHVSYTTGEKGALDPFRERYNSFSNKNCKAACTSLPRINLLSETIFDFNHNNADTACANSAYLPTILFSAKATVAEKQTKCSSAQSSERKQKCDSFAESSLSPKRATRSPVRNAAAEGILKVNAIKLPDGRFKCHVCSKLFSKTYTLKQHIDIAHSGDRLHRCPTCGKRFKTEDEKDVHSALHMTTDKKYKCSQCTREYHQRSELNRHIKEKHSEKPLGCHLCHRRYYRKDQFNKHILTHLNPKRRGRPPLNMDPGDEKLPP
uniref:C2H2-type domain-containing protein n=1 Tax=Glossina austeni TaxID=7395 RepID=A0A1A9VLP3_GLOAU